MDTVALEESPVGRIVRIVGGLSDGELAYVPEPLPRHLDLPGELVYRLDEASRAVATLAGVGETIPNPHLLIRPFMRREAVLSSRIEGTQASLSDVFMYEASGVKRRDVVEVINYIRALEAGFSDLAAIPISLRLMNKLHARLLEGARGKDKSPGALREEQVWIGNEGTEIGDARFVPPPSYMVRDLVLDWERFANEDPTTVPPLIQCAMLHYQFEAIHPYLDGNGRLGRLMIGLFLYAKGILRTPLLYLSAYFERDRALYYDQLYRLSLTGDWQTWLRYFLDGVIMQSKDALDRVRKIQLLEEGYRQRLMAAQETANAFKLVNELFAAPVVTAPGAAQLLGLTHPGANRLIGRLVSLGILRQAGETWPRVFVAFELLELLDEDRSP